MRNSILCCLVALGTLCVGCRHKAGGVTMDLSAIPIEKTRQFQLIAQANGPLEGLKYRFYADDGTCIPDISEKPESVFTPPTGTESRTIKVTVEAFRGDVLVQTATNKITVNPDLSKPDSGGPGAAEGDNSPVTGHAVIEITQIPNYDPSGGPDTRDNIAGVVRGVRDPQDFRVVLYARTDLWYIQPLLGSTVQINTDGTWNSWTHGGAEYAALLVRQGYRPSSSLSSLPSIDGASVVAVTSRTGTRQ